MKSEILEKSFWLGRFPVSGYVSPLSAIGLLDFALVLTLAPVLFICSCFPARTVEELSVCAMI